MSRELQGLPRSIWRAPLVPVALAFTAGIVLDRLVVIPIVSSLLALIGGLVAWLLCCRRQRSREALCCLALAVVGCGAGYHHRHCHLYPTDDIGELAPAEPRPVRIRGVLTAEPVYRPARSPDQRTLEDQLRSRDQAESTAGLLWVQSIYLADQWREVSGTVRLYFPGPPRGFHAGDSLEVAGRLARLPPAANPGGYDPAAHWRDQRVRAQLSVRQTPDAVQHLRTGWWASFPGWLGAVRTHGQKILVDSLPTNTRGVAAALLLGDGAPMTHRDWEKYIHSGILHVLAISGQHLVILAWALSGLFRLLGMRQRYGAIVIAAVLFLYALLTGGRPPALRSAVVAVGLCGGVFLYRPVLPANLFALAWIVVGLVNPTDLFDPGCQLSFLSVAVIRWGPLHYFEQADDPLDRLVEQARPAWERSLRWLLWQIGQAFLLSLVIWLAVTPLAAFHLHLVAPAGLLLGVPVSALATLALFAGFLLLLLSLLHPALPSVAAPLVHYPLALAEFLVDQAERWPTWLAAPDLPLWWVVIFYLVVLACLTQLPLRRRWSWGLVVGLAWLCLGLLCGAAPATSAGLRCTFLAVGHGGCTVLQTPDGRTLLYDAGAISGPEVTQRHIVPFLLSQGVRRIDEVFLSHADLDHFNGLVGLLDWFTIGQVTRTPTFSDKDNAPVRATLARLEQKRIPIRVTRAGDRFQAGSVTLTVLHPPAVGPDGNENARSLVLLVEHLGHRILLTGDLEGAGFQRVLGMDPTRVDVLQAPHHGSHRVDGGALARWGRPALVVSCQGTPLSIPRSPEIYRREGALFWSTHDHGAVTLVSEPGQLRARTWRTGQVVDLSAEEPTGTPEE
jgi:competence protein ComEC